MYFDRRKYKQFSLKQLQGRWGYAILISFIITLVSSIFDIPQLIRIYSETFRITAETYSQALQTTESLQDLYYELYNRLNEIRNTYGSFFEQLLRGAIDAILIVAALNFFIKMSKTPEKISLSAFLEGFADWWRALLAFLWKYLWIHIWMLLFIIPGIVKIFAYSQTEYLLAEYKNLSPTKAVKISNIITRGYKWEIFVMALSFLGWEILCAFSFGIGYIFLLPYRKMTYINAYHAMLKDAVECGKISMEDLYE